MRRQFSNLKIGQRMAVTIAISLVGIVAVVGGFLLKDHIQAGFAAKVDKMTEIGLTAQEIEKNLLQARRAETDFLLERSLDDVERHAAVSGDLGTEMETLARLISQSPVAELGGDMQKMQSTFESYRGTFSDLVAAAKKLGLNENEGEQGSLRTAVHSLEDRLKTRDDAEMQVMMLMMRRHEKDFMLRGASKYVDQLDAQAKELVALPEWRFGSAEDHELALRDIETYRKSFADYAATSIREADLRKQLNEIFSRIEPIFSKVEQAVAAKTASVTAQSERSSRTVLLILLATAAAVTGLTAIVLILVSRSITRPLVLTASAMRRFAEGDLDAPVPDPDRKDEVGQMVRALVHFRASEVERRRMVAEQEEAERNAIESRRRAERDAEERARKDFVSKVEPAFRALSEGDLTARLDRRSVVGFEAICDLFNRSVSSLEDVMNAILGSVETSRRGLAEINEASNTLAQRTEQQAANLEETVASLGEVTTAVDRTARGAGDARTEAASTRQNAQSGGEVVARAVGAMREIQDSSERMGTIIGVIDEIAFQTNLLALNAGVEAARAGDAGKGFAVVAQEVRQLAQRSADSAKEIRDLITTSRNQVGQGVELVTASGRALDDIVTRTAKMSAMIDEITRSAEEQAVSLKEISRAADDMDRITQQNAAMVEEATAASHALAQEMNNLGDMTSRFRVANNDTARNGLRSVA